MLSKLKRIYGFLHALAVVVSRRLPIPSKVFGPPKGIISDMKEWVAAYSRKLRLPADDCWYSRLRDPSFISYPEPRSLFPVPKVFPGEPKGDIPEVFTACLPDARIIIRSGLVISPDDRVFEQSCSWKRYFFPSEIEYNTLRPLLNPVELSGHYTTIMARAWRNYYHWNAECLTRLALLEHLPDVPILFPKKLTWWHKDSLAALGMDMDRIVELDDGCYQVDRLYFPSYTGITGDIADWAIRDLRERYCGTRPRTPKPGKRVFINRSGAVHRRVVNEDEVVRALESEEFTVMEAHNMTTAQKIEFLSDAEIIVGVHGAGMANIIFAPAGAVVIELLDPMHMIGVFYAMAENLGQKYWYLIGENISVREGKPIKKGFDDLWIPTEALLRTLEAAGAVGSHIPTTAGR